MTPAEIYRAYNDAENSADLARTRALVADDLRVTVNGRPQLASAEDDDRANRVLLETYPDYRREVLDIVEEGDRAAVRWRMRGTPRDPGEAALDVHGCSFIAVADGRIAAAHLYADGSALDDLLDHARGEEPRA